MRPFRMFILAVALFAAGFAAPSLAADALSPEQKSQVEQIIHDYLLKNPEVLVEAMAELEKRQREQAEAATQENIQRYRDAIFAAPHDYVVNPDGTVPVVEFFDYQCGYCKRLFPTLTKVKQSEDDVRVIYKEFPILSEASTFASKAAIAAREQGKYMDFHNALMELQGKLDEATILETAEAVGLDVEQLQRDMEAPEVLEIIKANHMLARALNIRGTPTLIIGDTLIPGAMDYDSLLATIEETRQSCQVC